MLSWSYASNVSGEVGEITAARDKRCVSPLIGCGLYRLNLNLAVTIGTSLFSDQADTGNLWVHVLSSLAVQEWVVL